jgi:Fe2+ transport system protein FeoA
MSPQTIPLSDLAVGAHALISKMGDDPHLCYLRCMGFCPGAHVELVRRQATAALISVRMEG